MARQRRSRASSAQVKPTDVGVPKQMELLDLELPGVDDINVPPTTLDAYKILIYGEKSLGKTSLCANFPGTFTIQLDPERRNIRARQYNVRVLPIDEVGEGENDPWNVIRTLIVKAASDPTVQNLHIDNFGRYYEAAVNSFCARNNIEDPSELSDNWSAGWRKVKAEYQTILSAWSDTGKGLLLTAHGRMHKIKPKDGSKSYDMYGPDLSESVWGYVKEICDFCFAYDMDTLGNRIMHVRANPFIWAANGTDEFFISPSGKPLHCIPMGKTPSESYQALSRAFSNEVFDADEEDELTFADAKPEKPATNRRQRKR